ncbi:ankyrin repeat and BTB/POZ domain-containing protein 1 isoform X2 [Hippocampus comes]|uniref:ankyrin repeat and BTB/POZ domain-containing protein 1 isoform X2 n=1 Tax=Hippocampus comes TaxID=109280 RepID=UPI00094E13AE|nr:PREDICTED: ankyrin repeat and BTB/POZ domain-containing protein 1 isoform X2 [Hippocampus comes]
MDGHDLFSSCRKGDICSVRYLVEERDVDLNVRDNWDSSPLYYACLCGHEELVQYLLASGAKCEANTFDGERCLYGSLNDSIRRLLKEYKCVGVRAMKRHDFNYFLHLLLEQGLHSDITFVVHGQMFTAHRCVLAALSEYFAEMFATKWTNKSLIHLKHPLINPAAFGAVLQYLYTGRADIDVSLVDDCRRLAKQCKMTDLVEELQLKCKRVYEFVSNKPGICVKVLSLEPHSCQLQEDMAQLADCALPPQLRVGFGALPFNRVDHLHTYPDVCFRVDGYDFLCHKLTQENAFDVLCVADVYLLPGLKRLCGKTLAKNLCEDNVLCVWKTAKLFRLSRLEDQCIEFMAKIIERLVEKEEFAEMVKEDAALLEKRHETDSVPLIDDIRFHIASNVQTYSAIEEANQKLGALEELLFSIDIDC